MDSRLHRRTLLRGFGTAMALPLLEGMLPLSALAQSIKPSQRPIRMAFLFVPNGVNMEHWTPKGKDLQFGNILEPLADLRGSINVLTGLAQANAEALKDGAGDHARSAAAWLTGCHPRKTYGADIKAGVSVDQIAARRLGHLTRFASLELGCERGGVAGNCDSGYSCAYSNSISWRSESTPMAKETNPRLVFERLFAAGDPGETAAARAQRQAENQSILDYLKDDTQRLQKKLGSHDRAKLDEYFTGIREIERRIAFLEKANQDGGQLAQIHGRIPDRPADYTERARLLGDMMVLAFQTDTTRISTFMFANEGSNTAYREIGIADGHHNLSHHDSKPENLDKLRRINRYHVEQLSYILHKMQSIREGDATLLDNSMVLYGSGIGDGNRHNHDDLPLVMCGKGGGSIKGGRHLVYEAKTPMNNLFVTMLDRVGIPVESIGDSTGRLQQLF